MTLSDRAIAQALALRFVFLPFIAAFRVQGPSAILPRAGRESELQF
jgi:hypothetical protein